ncbi:MFS transporter [Limibacter armeniacum]|uniref:MFS transporter n=1 Tax=Limibacter armeniacum TaxID=466084 RepID=UPI002FE5E7D4
MRNHADMTTDTIEQPSIYTLQFWLLCLSSFLFFTSFNMIIPELPDYLTKLGGEDYKGLIISLFTLTAGLSRPFSGKLTDKIGRIPVMVVGVLVTCVCSVLYPLVATPAAFLLLRFFHGFSTGFKPTGTSAYLADVVPFNRRGEAMGILGFFGSSGIGAGPVIGSYIAAQTNLDFMFYMSGALSLLSILILSGMKETLENPQRFKLEHLKVGPHEVIDKSALAPSIVMVLSVTAYGVMLTIIPDFSKYLGIENKGIFFLFFTLASTGVRIFAGRASDRHGRVIVLKISTVILASGLVLVGFASNMYLFMAAAVLMGLGAGMNSPTIFAWTVDRCKAESRGKALATMYIALEVGIGSGAFGAGWIYANESARLAYPFWVSAALCLLAFVYLMVWHHNKKPVTSWEIRK